MAQDLFDADEVVLGGYYGWYNIAAQRFCGTFRGITVEKWKGRPCNYLLMEYKKEVIKIREVPARFPKPLGELHVFKNQKELERFKKRNSTEIGR